MRMLPLTLANTAGTIRKLSERTGNFFRMQSGYQPNVSLRLSRSTGGGPFDRTFFLSLPLEEQQLYMHGVDALVTDVPEVCIAVSTADCVPVLLYAPDVKAVAAVHAGWRGTVLRIAGKTVRILMDEYGADPRLMKAGIAPSIGPEAFEVGEEVVDAFREAGFEMSCILKRDADTGKAHIDLWEANRLQLLTEAFRPEISN